MYLVDANETKLANAVDVSAEDMYYQKVQFIYEVALF